jgi:hypothetical protein
VGPSRGTGRCVSSSHSKRRRLASLPDGRLRRLCRASWLRGLRRMPRPWRPARRPSLCGLPAHRLCGYAPLSRMHTLGPAGVLGHARSHGSRPMADCSSCRRPNDPCRRRSSCRRPNCPCRRHAAGHPSSQCSKRPDSNSPMSRAHAGHRHAFEPDARSNSIGNMGKIGLPMFPKRHTRADQDASC